MLQDSTSIQGGYQQSLTDWQVGDDRIFTGDVSTIASGLLGTDPNLTDAYFTIKLNPSDVDANAILQKHITTFLGPAGQITQNNNLFASVLLFHIFSGDYEGLVQASTVYYWDFRVITKGGTTWTCASGQLQFQQQVTQTNKAGTQAALPMNGQPQIRGYTGSNPASQLPMGTFNVGDIFYNLAATVGSPVGWRCYASGSNGGWEPFYPGGTGPPVTGIIPPVQWLFVANGPPTVLTGIPQNSIAWNISNAVGGNIGWVLIGSTWYPFGGVSLA